MKQQVQGLLLSVSVFVLLLFVVFMVNQTAQVVQLANALNPRFGQFVLYAILTIYIIAIIIPTVVFIRTPKAIRPPATERAPQYEAYLKRLAVRLSSNSYLAGITIAPNDRATIETALKVLDAKASELIKSTASTVFVTTAISQNGRLDAVMALLTLSRLVWQIAFLYNQRPSLRELVQLYANVGGTVFFVSQIEDFDIAEQLEPILASVGGASIAGAVPGVGLVASVVTNSIVEGAANAFLTLRVGVVARKYCASTIRPDRELLRRSATVEAASMLPSVVSSSAGAVSKAIWAAFKKTAGGAVTLGTGGAWEAVSRIKSPLRKPAEGEGS